MKAHVSFLYNADLLLEGGGGQGSIFYLNFYFYFSALQKHTQMPTLTYTSSYSYSVHIRC